MINADHEDTTADSSSSQNQDMPKLTLREAVRINPYMFFGAKGHFGLHNLVWDVISVALNGLMNDGGDRIDLTLSPNNLISIADNGLGLAIERDPETDWPTINNIHADRALEKHIVNTSRKKVFFGSTVGLPEVNAASSEFSIQVKRNGWLWQQQFRLGIPQSDLHQIRPLLSDEPNGTVVSFRPDFSIFELQDFDYKFLLGRFREFAFLVPEITLALEDVRRSGEYCADVFSFPNGVKDYVCYLNRDYAVVHEPITIAEVVALERDFRQLDYTATIEIALQYAKVEQPLLLCFINTVGIEQGGTVTEGFMDAFIHVTTDYARNVGLISELNPRNFDEDGFSEDDIVYGLAAVINIWHPLPQFEGSMKYKLINPELKHPTYTLIRKAVEAFATEHPDQMRLIVEHCLANKALRYQRRYGVGE